MLYGRFFTAAHFPGKINGSALKNCCRVRADRATTPKHDWKKAVGL